MSDIGKNIREARKKKGISQEALSSGLNVTRQTVSNWETGKAYPDIETLKSIADLLEAGIIKIIYDDNERKGRRKYKYVSYQPVLGVMVFFFFLMTWGSVFSVPLFSSILGGGIAEEFLYPLYGGIVFLAGLLVLCTCLILEELRNQDFEEKEAN